MPLITGSSGEGYYYPVAQKPNSSFPSVDLRGVGTAPPAAGLGRIYVMSASGDLFYKDPSGNEIFLGSELSSSAGYVTGSTNFFVTDLLKVSGTLTNPVGHLILSSTVGSVVSFSASSDFSQVNRNYHIRSVNSHLILSSSIGSTVAFSGNISVMSGVLLGAGAAADRVKLASNSTILIVTSDTSSNATILASSYRDAGPTFVLTGDSFDLRQVGKIHWGQDGNGAAGNSREFQLISARTVLGHGAQSGTLALSSSTTGVNGMTLASLRGHLILSSSEGSTIKLSGALTYQRLTTATLPAAADILTGSIVWDDTRKTMKIYGPLGWTPILTGTAG